MKLYDKANSILEIRQDARDYQNVFERIRRLCDAFDKHPASAYETSIIKQACDDVVAGSAAGEAARFALREHVVEEIGRLSDEELPRYICYRYRYDVFPYKKQLDDFPPCLQIEPASICNYRCVFCYHTDRELTLPKNGYMGLMTLELFKKVIDQAEGKCEALSLASRGEPLINRDIEDMLAYAAGKFLALKINTNAWFLDERKSHAILQAGVSTLVFSADAASEPLYSQLRVNGKLDRILANIRQFQEIRAHHYPDSITITRVSGVRFGDDQNLDDMEQFWGDLVDQVAFVKYNPWENTYDRPVNDVTTPCSDLWRRMFVWWDGTINPCDVDYLSTLAVGDADNEELSEIWNGDKYNALRKAHLACRRNSITPCMRCTFV
jgi:radical SAM protein with 4Fe4S-binding SPASM domain